MAHSEEAMDIDSVCDFDNKENSFQHNNALPRTPCTEKGYEELDVSELNMKLRYSITPTASPMSKSFTANSVDEKKYDAVDNCGIINENANMTRSLNLNITNNFTKCQKTLPLQTLLPDLNVDCNRSALRKLESAISVDSNINVSVTAPEETFDNLSLPSSSSSAIHTPQATTPTKDIPKQDGGSPIMRGLKNVFNLFRPSQSPIPVIEDEKIDKRIDSLSPPVVHSPETSQSNPQAILASTPLTAQKTDVLSKRSSPNRDSIVFNDDLEKELQWKDETTIIFSKEKIYIHKLFFQQPTGTTKPNLEVAKQEGNDKLDNTVEYMDISYNDSVLNTETIPDMPTEELKLATESDSEFLDCESFSKNEPETDISFQSQEDPIVTPKEEKTNEIVAAEDNASSSLNETLNATISNVSTLSTDTTKADIITDPLKSPFKAENFMKENDLQQNFLVSAENIVSEATIPICQPPSHVSHNLICLPSESVMEMCNDSIIHTSTKIGPINDENANFSTCVLKNHIGDVPLNKSENNIAPIDCIGIGSLSQIPLIADPRVLLFNISGENTSDKIFVAEHVTSYESNTSPADVPLPDDNDTLFEATKCSLQTNNEISISVPLQEKLEGNVFGTDEVKINDTGALLHNKESSHVDFSEETCVEDSSETNILGQDFALETMVPVKEMDSTSKTDVNCLDVTVKVENDIKIESVEDISQSIEKSQELPKDILPVSDYCDKVCVAAIEEKVENTGDRDKLIPEECVDDKNSDTLPNSTDVTTRVNNDINRKFSPMLEIKQTTLDYGDQGIYVNINLTETKDTISEPLLIKTEIVTESGNMLLENQNVLIEKIGCTQDFDVNMHVQRQSPNADKPTVSYKKEMNTDVPLLVKDVTDDCKVETTTETDSSILMSSDNLNSDEEVKLICQEIITSANNSPFISVLTDAEYIAEEVPITDVAEEQTTSKSNNNISPPISPKIVSKGYNFNFDEIDDPFATKTKIRMSPPLAVSLNRSLVLNKSNDNFKDMSKKDKNKRKSQPGKRKSIITSKKSNFTFDNLSRGDSTDTEESLIAKYDNNMSIDQNKEDIANNSNMPFNDKDCVSEKWQTHAVEKINTVNMVTEVSYVDSSSTLLTVPESVSQAENLCSDESIISQKLSSETFTYNSAESLSGDAIKTQNVFNLPEIDDINFNSLASKIKLNPLSSTNSSNTINKLPETCSKQESMAESKSIENSLQEKESTVHNENETLCNISNTTCSSKATDGKDTTVLEVNTEDEDTIEGPFLEAEYLKDDKNIDFESEKAEMLQFSNLPAQENDDNMDAGELFIDAEAYEFLLNQNQTNVVADCGKESLFLKFDPLFAKRMSSDGVVAASKKVQNKQSTPKRKQLSAEREIADVDSTQIAGSSTFNMTHEFDVTNVLDESSDDFNITVSKPMMVVNPAVNPVVIARTRPTVPAVANRRSLTFTSPAIAVIDRLLSLSGNGSFVGHDATITDVPREQNEADMALTQLRELLADKEINVYNLRSESRELKQRLTSLESQMKSLESISEQRLKKINELTEKLNEKTKSNKTMEKIVEEYERTIASLMAETDQDKRRHVEERLQLIQERDEQTAHLESMEVSFNDLHSKYEKSKQIILGFKINEDSSKKAIKEFEENLAKMQNNYELLKQHATTKLNHANDELQKINRSHESEILKLNAMIKRKELHITSLEETLLQKTKANEELTAICDELITKVG